MGPTLDHLLEFISAKLPPGADGVDGDTLLFSSGVLDSFVMIDLLTFVESAAGIRFGPTDVTLDNLDSLNRILGFVESKQSG